MSSQCSRTFVSSSDTSDFAYACFQIYKIDPEWWHAFNNFGIHSGFYSSKLHVCLNNEVVMRTKKMLDLTPPKWTLIVNKKINSWYYGWNYLKWIVYKEPNPKILQTFKQKKKKCIKWVRAANINHISIYESPRLNLDKNHTHH